MDSVWKTDYEWSTVGTTLICEILWVYLKLKRGDFFSISSREENPEFFLFGHWQNFKALQQSG